MGDGGFGWFDSELALFGCELSGGESCPYSVHVCWWVLECVVEALGFDWAVFADFACFGYVGDVFVFFGEHLVGFVFAVGVLHPLVVCHFLCVLRVVGGCFVCFVWWMILCIQGLGMVRPWARWVSLMRPMMVMWVSVCFQR